MRRWVLTAVRSKSWRSLAFITALMTVLALAVPFGTALASHSGTPTTAAHDLDAGPETASNPTGQAHTVTATVADCPASTGGGADICEVDWEFESGPGVTVLTQGGATSNTASDDGNTPTSPDATCVIAENAIAGNPAATTTACSISFTSSTAGTVVVRAFVDDDRNNSTNNNIDLDTTEGRNEATVPGDVSETDDTDVVEKTFFSPASATTKLDCGPESATNPSTGADSAETYTCTAFTDTDADNFRDAGEAAVAGQVIDAENLNGPNDPDNDAAGGAASTADFNNAGTTDANGQATITIAAAEAQAGDALICFWIDDDNDAIFNAAGDQNDGGNCDEAGEQTVNVDNANSTVIGDLNGAGSGAGFEARDDRTDVVRKRWRARGVPANIVLSPPSDQNLRNTSHTVTATVTDFFGDPVAGVNVDFDITAGSRNGTAAVEGPDRITAADGTATFTYTDSTAAIATEPGTDTINAWIDNNTENDADADPGVDTVEPDDTASKFWFNTLPTAGQVELDMQMDDSLPTTLGGPDTNECPDATDGVYNANATAANVVGNTHEVCATVRTASATVISGAQVTFTVDGEAFFTNANGDDLGQTFTTGADVNGDAQAAINSFGTGTFTVTATSGSATDSGTKTYTGAAARTLSCTPTTASNPPGTSHIVTCEARDAYGNLTNEAGVADTVTFTESGTGRITSASPAALGTAGTGKVEVVTATTNTESGEQTITAELTDDVGDDTPGPDADTNECDRPAGFGPGGVGVVSGAPAGVCEQTVTKTWEEQPVTQCDDGVDNDGDGWVDFPDDPGCDDAADDDESNEPVVTQHSRTAEITNFKHIDLPGKKKPALMVKGRVTVDDGFDACANQVPVKVQIRASGEWITRKTDSTNENGVFKVLVRHVHAKYRVVAPAIDLADEHGDIDQCLKASDGARYDH